MPSFEQIDFRSLPVTAAMIFLTVILMFLIYKIVSFIKYKAVIGRVPGPKGYPLIGNLMEILVPSDKLFNVLSDNSRKFYPACRLVSAYTEAIFLSSPSDAETILSGMKHLEKSIMYDTLRSWLQEGLLLSDGSKWQYRRKVLTPTFHFNILQGFCEVFIAQSQKLVEELKKNLNRSVDVVPILTEFTLHTICETAMGITLEKSGDNYRNAIYRMGENAIYRIIRPWLYPPIMYIFSTKFWQTLYTSRFLHNFSMKVIKEREKLLNPSDIVVTKDGFQFNVKKKMAMLDLLLSVKRSNSSIDDKGIQEEVDTFMFEGHDTTAMSISFTLFLLANHKDIQDKVAAELAEIFGDSDRPITMTDLSQMKYLERVLKESLRLYPSVPMIGRCTSEDMVTSNGYKLPKGTTAMVRIYDIHRIPEIYPDPEKFDPDRFLPENSKGRHPYAYIPFSAGPRNCIGQKFAMLELKSAVSAVIRNFELEAIDTPETIRLQADIIIRTLDGLKMKFKLRKSVNV